MLFSAMYTGLVLPLELQMFVGGCTHSGSEGWDPVACLWVYSQIVGVLSCGGGWGQWVYSQWWRGVGSVGLLTVVEDGVNGYTHSGSRGWGQWVYSMVENGVSRCTQWWRRMGSAGVLTVVEEDGVSECTHSGSRGGLTVVVEDGVSGCTPTGCRRVGSVGVFSGGGGWDQWVYSHW